MSIQYLYHFEAEDHSRISVLKYDLDDVDGITKRTISIEIVDAKARSTEHAELLARHDAGEIDIDPYCASAYRPIAPV